MSRLEPLQTSTLSIYPLTSSESRMALSVFSQLLLSCAGPHGKNHIVRNNCGGHMTITSMCCRLLSSVSISRSELKLVVCALSGHLQQTLDCGLFMAHICLGLTNSTLNLNLNHNVVSSVFQSFVSIIVDYIRSDSCVVCVKADFSNVSILLSYVKSILTSKSLLNIPPQHLKHVTLTVLDAFVKAIPSSATQTYSNGVYILGEEKQPVNKCRIIDGILLECPYLEMFSDIAEMISRKWTNVVRDEQSELRVKVALITCSMSGDCDVVVQAAYEGTEAQFEELDECVMKKMLNLCDELEREEVGIVLCQRVIHPKIKSHLLARSIVFVDRIGLQPIAFLKDLTGCQPVTSILQSGLDLSRCLGTLTSVEPCVEVNKKYLSLQNTNSSAVTLVVCAEWEERLTELKECVQTCLRGLESLAKEPRLLMGGGCWQMHCSQILAKKVLASLREMSEKCSCPERSVRELLKVFVSCLNQWCLSLKSDTEHLCVDSSSNHCWRVAKNSSAPLLNEKDQFCSCGLRTMSSACLQNLDIVMADWDKFSLSETGITSSIDVKSVEESDCVVLDNLTACVEALQRGVLTTGLLLSVGQFVCDRN